MCYVQYSDCVQDLDYRILIVLSVVLSDCRKPMNNSRDPAFSNSGLEVGLRAFQLPMFAKCDAVPERDLCDMFVEESAFLWKSKPPLPTRSLRSLRATVPATSSELLHHAHPFVAAAGKTCLMQRIEQLSKLSSDLPWVRSVDASLLAADVR